MRPQVGVLPFLMASVSLQKARESIETVSWNSGMSSVEHWPCFTEYTLTFSPFYGKRKKPWFLSLPGDPLNHGDLLLPPAFSLSSSACLGLTMTSLQ